MKLNVILNGIADFSKEHSNAILTGMIIAGTVSTTILATRGGMRYRDAIENEEARTKSKLDNKEKAKIIVKEFYLVAITGSLTIAAALINMRENNVKIAAITAAYNVISSEKESVIKIIDEVTDKRTKEAIEQKIKEKKETNEIKHIKNVNNVNNNIQPHSNGTKMYQYYDPYFGHMFWSTKNEVDAIINTANDILVHNGQLALSDLYGLFDFTPSELSGNYEWDINDGGLISIIESADIIDNTPTVILRFDHDPKLIF